MFSILYGVIFLSIIALGESSKTCKLYLAPSLFPDVGFGIFSGEEFKSNDIIDTSSTLLFDNTLIQETKLMNYVYGSHTKEYSMCALGSLSMMNHKDKANSYHAFSKADPSGNNVRNIKTHPYTTSRNFDMIAKGKISAGEEIFSSYGGEVWFTARNITYVHQVNKPLSKHRYSLKTLREVGHCLSDIKLGLSSMPMAGRGVLADRSFSKGESVSISPVLILPRHIIRREETSSMLMNYCLATPNSEVVGLPIGKASMCNHGGKLRSNLKLRWYDWNSRKPIEIFSFLNDTTKSTLTDSSNIVLYLGYYASRAIDENEELTIDYGEDWENEYMTYLDALEHWMTVRKEDIKAARETKTDPNALERLYTEAPQFRHPVGLPDDLFPDDIFANYFVDGGGSSSLCSEYRGTISAACVARELDKHSSTALSLEAIAQNRKYMKVVGAAGGRGGAVEKEKEEECMLVEPPVNA